MDSEREGLTMGALAPSAGAVVGTAWAATKAAATKTALRRRLAIFMASASHARGTMLSYQRSRSRSD